MNVEKTKEIVATLGLGSQLKQGFVKVRAKSEV
jgi:hypothetical protein